MERMNCVDINLHLQTLSGYNEDNQEDSDSSHDSDLEVTSDIDETESRVINFNTYLTTNFDEYETDDELENNPPSASRCNSITNGEKKSSNTSANETETEDNSRACDQKQTTTMVHS